MNAAPVDVFLSYSRTDAPAVRQIQAYLQQAGLATFLDRDQLPAGQPWLSALETGDARCAAIAVLVGPAGLGTWQQREVQLALDRQAVAERAGRTFPVIPILLPKVEDPPGGFLRLQTWVDLRSDLADPIQLYLLLTGIRGQAPACASPLREALCPYRGLLPFREEDAGLFFGREEATDTLLGRLRDHNFVTLVGRSGSGKSSVVFAGLIPALRRRADGRTWSILSLRPGPEPLHALVRLFDPPPVDLPPFEIDQRVEQQVTILRTDDHALGRRIRSLLATAEETGTDRLLLHVDQWEELYAQALRNPALEPELAERDVTQFINLLLDATRTSPCTVVLTVRADFYGEFLKHGPLAAAVPPGQLNLGPLNREGLVSIIEEPAKAVGLTVDPPLLEELVDEVYGDLGKLPLLEYALKETWRRREGQHMTLNAYGQAGGIDGAVAQRANQLFTSLSQTQQSAARRLFVSLVTPGEVRGDTRARAVYPEHDDAIAAVIDKFSAADARLLVTGEDAPSTRRLVEISHEAMIREWDLLKTWIESNREALRRREHIRARLRQWEEQDRDPTLLIPPGLPLEEGRKLLADHGDVLIDEVQPYITASIVADEERRKQAEATAEAERQRELATAQRLASEQRKRAHVAMGLSLVALLLAAGAVWGWLEAQRYAKQSEEKNILGIIVEHRETTIDLSRWQETTNSDIEDRVKKSLAISKNRFLIQRTGLQATAFVHRVGTSSGIKPEVRCSDCRVIPRDVGEAARAPHEWDIIFDISNLKLEEKRTFEFAVLFWNSFQYPEQWWAGFRILHSTEISVFSVVFPEHKRPRQDTLTYVYFDNGEHPYGKELRTTIKADPTGRVDKIVWEVPAPRGDRSYRVKWDWTQ